MPNDKLRVDFLFLGDVIALHGLGVFFRVFATDRGLLQESSRGVRRILEFAYWDFRVAEMCPDG